MTIWHHHNTVIISKKSGLSSDVRSLRLSRHTGTAHGPFLQDFSNTSISRLCNLHNFKTVGFLSPFFQSHSFSLDPFCFKNTLQHLYWDKNCKEHLGFCSPPLVLNNANQKDLCCNGVSFHISIKQKNIDPPPPPTQRKKKFFFKTWVASHFSFQTSQAFSKQEQN